MFTPLITHDSDGTALAAPVDAARRNGATYKTRTIDDLRIKDDRLRAAIEGTVQESDKAILAAQEEAQKQAENSLNKVFDMFGRENVRVKDE